MASASITTRKTRSGARRYVVRFRRGGRYFPVEHGGSFSTMREARTPPRALSPGSSPLAAIPGRL